jgi:uncharacterized membrane protein HdeD (DUF308 family)
MGFLTAAIGIVMIVYPMATAAVSTLFFGSTLILAGVVQAVFAFTSDTVGNFFLKLLLGVLYAVAGIALIAFPPAGVLTLTMAIGIMLIADAFIEMAIGFSLPAGGGRGWFVVSSIASALLGILILSEWPNSAAWTIGTLLGTSVLFTAISRIVVSSVALKDAHDLRHLPKAA